MGESTLDVAVVGVGHLGRHHARIYASMPDVRLVAVVDRDRERAAEIAAEHGCRPLADPSSLAGRVQAASIAVPTESHREVAEQLISAGADVLIEKPIAVSVAEGEAILEAAARGSRLVMVGHTERFNPAVAALSRAVEAPRFFEIHRLAAFSARSTDIDVVRDLMIHDLDLVQALDGTEPVTVDAVGIAALTDKVDIANARIRFASGCVANLTASRISDAPVRRVRVFQARTYLSCDTQRRCVDRHRLVLAGGGEPRIQHDRLPVEDGEPLALELCAFVDCVRRRIPPPVDGRQGIRALALAQQVHAAIERSPFAS